MTFTPRARALLLAVLTLTSLLAGRTTVARAATPLVIGVDHVDAANQQPFPPFNRLFEYTDFFSRSVNVHQGDTIDFRAAPFSFHIVALATSAPVARAVYPVEFNRNQGDGADIAAGSGVPKLVVGASNFPIVGGSTSGGGTVTWTDGKGPPVCGLSGQPVCVFSGGNDIEVIGPTPGFNATGPVAVDQLVQITAAPGTYTYYDTLHPGMSGTLTVVPPSQPASTQAEIDAASQAQFQADQAFGLAVEAALNQITDPTGNPGSRWFIRLMGASTPDEHVQIDEMLPNRPMNLVPGDKVTWLWDDPQATHTLGIARDETALPAPFGYDCGTGNPSYISVNNSFGTPVPPAPPTCQPNAPHPTYIGDPGFSPPGTRLTSPTQVLDAGLRLGVQFGIVPSSQFWTATTGSDTAHGTYSFVCTLHDWMVGTINI